ncbi:MAG: MgtC/SapB family protein [Patescibacteria group bacterium]
MDPLTREIMIKILLALILGLIVGFERWYKGKAAGIRTYALVSMGSALFTVLSVHGFGQSFGTDPSRVAAQVVVGVGFIGAGLIFFRDGGVRGLTTAAGIWASSAIGMAVGVGFYSVAIYTVFLTLLILAGIRFIEKMMPRPPEKDRESSDASDE